MYKKYVIFICFLSIFEVKCDCDTYIECFNDFFESFFAKDAEKIENVNATNLPENFDQIQDIHVNELSKVLTEIQSFIQSDTAHRIKTEPDSPILEKVNGNTKIYVQRFNYNGNFENIFTPIEFEREESVLTESPVKVVIPVEENKKFNNKINEISNTDDFNAYYDIIDDNSTDYPVIDYVELYKDTTNEELVYDPPSTTVSIKDEIEQKIEELNLEIDEPFDKDANISSCHGKTSGVKQTFPWIATIFIKESPGNQYNYYCDGALVNENHLITAARCMQDSNSTIKPEDVLVFLGKRSLQAVGDNEKTVKITKILTHENFTSANGIFENDLAILTLEETVTPNDVIRPACLDEEGGSVDQSATTAWTVTGDLTPVYFIDKQSGCDGEGKNIICATYGNEVPLCPNYGGIYIIRRSKLWYLRGIRTGDPTDRGICFNKNVQYTNLENYQDWIVSNINSK